MQGNASFLDGGQELAALYDKDPLQAILVERMIAAINQLGQNSAVSPIGDHEAPAPVDNLSVKAAGEMVHFSITHSARVRRNIRYFIEADTSPAFPRPIVTDLGSSRSSHPLNLPSLDDSGNQLSWYFRAYAQYPGSRPSVPTVVGGANNPTAIKLQGSTKLTLLTPGGSGTASTTGMQGGSGLGKTPVSSNAVLRTGKLQGTPPVAAVSAIPPSQVVTQVFNTRTISMVVGNNQIASLTITPSGGSLVAGLTVALTNTDAVNSSTMVVTIYKGDITGTPIGTQTYVIPPSGTLPISLPGADSSAPTVFQTYTVYVNSSTTGTATGLGFLLSYSSRVDTGATFHIH